ncbi:MAG: hypothetical protein IJE21_06955 [Alistipes sp.]|nr:hypothetical protein [Alistipes sp.]
MKQIRFILILLGIFICNGCYEEKSPYPSYHIEATVAFYIGINRSNINEFAPRDVVVANVDNGKIDLGLFISRNLVASIIDFALGEGTAEQYAELREEFGDFNPNFCSVYSPPPRYIGTMSPQYQVSGLYFYWYVLCEKICALTVTSSADWDSAHPAGASLNDLFDIDFYSIYPYIKRGFTGDVLTYQQKPLSELAEGDLWLCAADYEIHLLSASLPVIGGTHTIFVTLTLDTGEKIVYSTDYTFE